MLITSWLTMSWPNSEITRASLGSTCCATRGFSWLDHYQINLSLAHRFIQNGSIAWFVVGYGWYSLAPLQADEFFNRLNPTIDTILSAFLGSLVSGLVLGFVGTTPGKSIFGIRVKTLKGQSIGASKGIARDLTIFMKGLGLGLPFISLITLILSYRQLKQNQVMSWDAGQFTVTYRRNTGAQIAMTIAGIVLYGVIIALLLAVAQMP